MIIIFLIGILAVTCIWNYYYQRHWDKKIEVRLQFAEDSVYAGEKTQMIEQIENRKRLPLPVIEIAFHMKKELVFQGVENTSVSDFTYKRDIFSLLGNQRITRNLSVACTKRGYYSIEKIDCQASSFLYESSYIKQLPVHTELYVYAKRADVSGILTTCEKMMGAMQCEKRLYEDPFAFSSIREYTITDPMKTINWKASAKTGGLMVNTFESTLTECVMIYLDLEDRGIIKHENLVEESISVAATLAQKMIHRGMEVGIAANVYGTQTGTLRIEPENGARQLVLIEKLLAMRNEAEKISTFEEILVNHPGDAVAILISKNAAAENQEVINRFLGKTQGIWILPFEENMQETVKMERNLTVIRREVAYR